jgi:hypothetical protein
MDYDKKLKKLAPTKKIHKEAKLSGGRRSLQHQLPPG